MARNDVEYRIGAVDDTKGAIQSALANFKSLQTAIQGIGTGFAGISATLGATALAAFANRGIELAASLDDLSEKTTLSVEQLDQLAQVARIGGRDLSEVTGIASKFAKAVGEAAGGNEEMVKAFQDLGISVKDLKSQSFDELFTRFARTIADASNQQTAFAVGSKVAGRNLAEALPFLKDWLAEGSRAARITTEQAAAAEEFQKNYGRLKLQVEGLAIAIGNELVPRFNDVAEAMSRARRESEGFWGAMLRGAQTWFTGTDLDKARRDFRSLSDELVSVDKAIEKRLEMTGGAEQPFITALRRRREEIKEELNRVNALLIAGEQPLSPKVEPDKPKVGESSLKSAATGVDKYAEGLKALDAELAKATDDGNKFIEVLNLISAGAYGPKPQRDAAARDELLNRAAAIEAAKQDLALQKEIEQVRDRAAEKAAAAYRAEYEALAKLADEADPIRQLNAEIEKIAKAVNEGLLSEDAGEVLTFKRIDAYNRAQKVFGETVKEADTLKDVGRDVGLVFESALGDLIRQGGNLRDMFKALGQDLAQLITKWAIIKPLEGEFEKMFKSDGGDGGIFGSLFKGITAAAGGLWDALKGALPSFAVGTDYVPRDMIAQIHQGEKIIPAGQSDAPAVNITLNASAIDARGLDALLVSRAKTIAGVVRGSYNLAGRRYAGTV